MPSPESLRGMPLDRPPRPGSLDLRQTPVVQHPWSLPAPLPASYARMRHPAASVPALGRGSARPMAAPRPGDSSRSTPAVVTAPTGGFASTAGTAAPRTPVFIAHRLTKIYRMGEIEVQALREVDLDIREGEFVVLLGPSGSGKSTLLNILGGLDVPTSGEAFWRDHDLAKASERELTRYRRDHVGFVFQFYNLIPSLTVRENVALVTDIAPHPMSADEAIDLVGLAPRANHFPSQLSGGEQQRVAIARAIVKRPDVLLCDEPTGALDYVTGKVVLEVIAKINAELGTTAVVITHNAAIAGMADRILHLADGRITHVDANARKLTPSELSW